MKRTLTYWVCHRFTDRASYSFRARTRRECVAFLNPAGEPQDEIEFRQANYSAPCKVVVRYTTPLDLLQQCLGEGGLVEESKSRDEVDQSADGEPML